MSELNLGIIGGGQLGPALQVDVQGEGVGIEGGQAAAGRIKNASHVF